jgi:hypothetical protein
MAKAIRGNAGRQPPARSSSHADVDNQFAPQVPHLQPIVKQVDEIFRATLAELLYAVKWKRRTTGSRISDISSSWPLRTCQCRLLWRRRV